jgi:hypothetical protein
MLRKHDCLQLLICNVEIHCDGSFPRGRDALKRRIRGGRLDIAGRRSLAARLAFRVPKSLLGRIDVMEYSTSSERLDKSISLSKKSWKSSEKHVKTLQVDSVLESKRLNEAMQYRIRTGGY